MTNPVSVKHIADCQRPIVKKGCSFRFFTDDSIYRKSFIAFACKFRGIEAVDDAPVNGVTLVVIL